MHSHTVKSTIINPIYLANNDNNNEQISNQIIPKNNLISTILNKNDLISIRLNRSFKSKKIKNLISANETKLELVNNTIKQDIQTQSSGNKHKWTTVNSLLIRNQTESISNQIIEDDEPLKGNNISIMLQKAEEFIKNSLDNSQTEFQIKNSIVESVKIPIDKNDFLSETNNGTTEQISDMLKSAEIFIKNSLDLNSKIKIKRKTSRRISNKLKNSALPVVNYSRLLKPSKNYEKLFINESYRNLEKQDIKA